MHFLCATCMMRGDGRRGAARLELPCSCVYALTIMTLKPRPYQGHCRHRSLSFSHMLPHKRVYTQERAHIQGGTGWETGEEDRESRGGIILMKKSSVQYPNPTSTQLCFLLMEITQSRSGLSSSYLTLHTTTSRWVCVYVCLWRGCLI